MKWLKKKNFLDSEMKTSIQTLLEENILVAHNASFDIKMFEKEGIKINQYIDTYKVSYYLDFQGKFRSIAFNICDIIIT